MCALSKDVYHFQIYSCLSFQQLHHFTLFYSDSVKYRPQVYEWTVRGLVATRDRHLQS